MKKLRNHQSEALNVASRNKIGIIQLPTGTGKTMIESHLIIENISNSWNEILEGEIPVFVILAPRILLANQIYRDVQEFVVNNRMDVQYMIVHSGRPDQEEFGYEEDMPFREMTSTTSSFQVIEEYNRAQREKVPLIIIGTYHSAPRIIESGIPVYMSINDEAHYLVSEEFNKLINFEENEHILNAKRKYFFTATLKETHSERGLGMNNEEFYGKIIYSRTPLEMIRAGEIVRPRIHLVNVESNEEIDEVNEIDLDVNSIIESFIEHRTLIKNGPKLLIVTKGTEHLHDIINHARIQQMLRTRPNLKIFAISSRDGALINGIKVKRDVFLTKLRELTDQDEAIIFHINILTEGIDVPGISGVMLMNNMKLSKFLQTLGRATRLHPNDRERLYEGSLEWNDLDNFIKDYAYIVIPTYGEIGNDLRDQISDIIHGLRHYGFEAREDVVIRQRRGVTLPKPIDTINELDTRARALFDVILDVTHEIEVKEEANALDLREAELKRETFEELLEAFRNE